MVADQNGFESTVFVQQPGVGLRSMKKVVLAAALVGSLVLSGSALSPSFAAAKKPLQVVVTGPSTASVTHSYSAKINLVKPIQGLTCSVLLNGNIKTQTTSIKSRGKTTITVASSFIKKQYLLGKRVAVLTVSCSNGSYAGTSLPHLLTFVR